LSPGDADSAQSADEPRATRVPTVVLTGFLGSGKTTLLNRLMRARPERAGRWAIVVNELGDVGIDGDLLPADMTRQVELPGGCICCVLNEDLDNTILELLDAAPDVDTIVIETTGVAEPLPIAWSLTREPLSERVRLAAVIAVVDPREFASQRPLSPAVDAQVEYADILVVSKRDLLGDAPLPEPVRAALAQLNPDALVLDDTPDAIPALVWRALADPVWPDSDAHAPRPRAATDVHSSQHAHHGDSDRVYGAPHGFETIWLPIENTLDFEELGEQLEALPANYVRIKGIARVVDGSTGSTEPHFIAFHRVGVRVSREPLAGVAPTRIVALGRGIERAPLAACLAAAVVPCDS
jgi:G3E family GTPase